MEQTLVTMVDESACAKISTIEEMGSKDPHPARSVVAALHREAQQAVLAFVPLCFAHSDLSQRSSQTP